MPSAASTSTSLRTSVLIVGGGPVGLALAGDLGWRGVDYILVEQTDGVIDTPKMNEVNVRSMEFCRRWGIDDQVINCPFPPDYPMDIAFVTSLDGFEMGRMERPAKKDQRPGPNSPVQLQICSQLWFDPILKEFASSFPSAHLLHRHQLESWEQSADGVMARVTQLEDGEAITVEADYLVACDGATSAIRDGLGIGLEGTMSLGRPVHFYFRAPDLLKNLGCRPTTFFLAFDREGLWANVRIVDPVNAMWRLMVLDTPADFEVDDIARDAFMRRAIGRDYDVEWIGTSVWTRRGVVAERLSEGRVFIAGDAAHQLSPTGALGMNTGLGDAVDLGWKLAATIEGWGGRGLLPSYDAERRPVGTRNVTKAAELYSHHLAFQEFEGIEDASVAGDRLRERLGRELVEKVGQMFRTEGLQIGYRYADSPICIPDGKPAPSDAIEAYHPNACPGARAPHAWIADGKSTLDLFGRGFVLLRFDSASMDPLLEAAKKAKMPIEAIAIDDREIHQLYGAALVLVRPDGHVAWRGEKVPANPRAIIDCARGAG